MTEEVYIVWDIYDGVRSGIADFEGQPHYFCCRFDDQTNDFSEFFDLKKFDAATLERALEQWAIYRTWEAKFHSGDVSLDSHPGHGGVDERYDKLDSILKRRIEAAPTAAKVRANFKAKERQPNRPEGCLRDMEVVWF